MGFVGYKVFGPGSTDRLDGPLQLFSPKPPEEKKKRLRRRLTATQILKFPDFGQSRLRHHQRRSAGAALGAARLPPPLVSWAAASRSTPTWAAIRRRLLSPTRDRRTLEARRLGLRRQQCRQCCRRCFSRAAPSPPRWAHAGSNRAAAGNLRSLTGRRIGGGNALTRAGVARTQGQAATNMRRAGGQFDGGASS